MEQQRKEREPPGPSKHSQEGHVVADILENRKTGAQYRRCEALGEGGFATCYEVENLETGERFAAKCVPKKSIKNQKQKSKLLSEIRIQQALSHKNIVGFVEAFEDDDNVFIILELCERSTFIELLKARRRLNEDETRFYMRQLLDAVRYMHSKRIIHRDLKLGNLFIAADMSLKIGDFGLAAVLKGDDDRKKTICGTPNYIAPEVLFDQENGHRHEVDIWSLGVIMYTLLVGRPPFQTKDVKAIYQKIRENSYEFPATVTLSDAARSLITSLLTTRPDHRPNIEDIMEHPFFESETNHTPESMPTSIFERPYVPPTPPARSDPLSSISKTLASAALSLRNARPDPFARATLQRQIIVGRGSNRSEPAPAVAEQHKGTASLAPPAPTPTATRTSPRAAEKKRAPAAAENIPEPVKPRRTEARTVAGLPRSPLRERSPNIQRTPAASSDFNHGSPKRPEPSPATTEIRGTPGRSQGSKANSSILTNILEHLEGCFDGNGTPSRKTAASSSSRQHRSSSEEPLAFVHKWIDYSHKYGLGYQLTNGSIGVFFNDSTSMILSGDQEHFEYVSYQRQGVKSSFVRRSHTLSNYPSDLKKKVTLLCHFKNYITENLSRHTPTYFQLDTEKVDNLDFLTKYIRTNKAFIFRLSNRVLQVNFLDHTKIILYSEGKMMAYVDHNKEIEMLPVEDFVDSEDPDVVGRIKYVRDVLRTLCQN